MEYFLRTEYVLDCRLIVKIYHQLSSMEIVVSTKIEK